MSTGMKWKGIKIIAITNNTYIGFTQDNLGVWAVFEMNVIIESPVKTIHGLTHKIKLYDISGTHWRNRLTDVRPRIHHK